MKPTLKIIIVAIMAMIIVLNGGNSLAQLDDRFGSKGVEGTMYLGQKGLKWYSDWQDSYIPDNYPPPGKDKIWTVGKIDYRTDGLGMDYRWIILDLLEDTEVDLLQNFLDLCLAVIDSNIIPIIGDYWTENRPILEKQLEDTLNNFTYYDWILGIKHRGQCKNTDIAFQETLPEFELTVKGDTILFNTSLSADWKTHIYIHAWILNPNPFNWGYYWQGIGDADCKFKTTISVSGMIGLEGKGRDRFLQIKTVIADSKTNSNIDWSLFGISFKWDDLSNNVENLIDKEIEKALAKELNKEPITSPYYFVDFFKSLFSEEIVPTQQEILDRIWEEEKNRIETVIKGEGYKGGYWSVGYEPNWFPMLEPEQYAEYYTKYYRFIKGLDSDAKVLGPSIFLTEAIDNPGEVVWLFIPELFQGPFAAVKQEFKNLVTSYFKMADSKNWYRKFINHLPNDVKLDVNDFHIFPMNADIQSIEWDSIKILMDEMSIFMREVSQAEEVWVTEFGNIDGKRSENEVAEMCRNFCQYFKSNTVGIKRWFWYLSHGHSPFYDLPFTPKPPMTALLKDDFSLTQIGTAYLFEADCTSPMMESAPKIYTSRRKIAVNWKEAREYDTGITDYHLEVKTEPGNIIIFNEWVGNRLSQVIAYDAGQKLVARVQAKNGAGLISEWSKWSNEITEKILDSMDAEVAKGLSPEKMLDQNSLPVENSDHSQKFIQKTNSSKQNDEPIGSESVLIEVPNSVELSQNYPNPFNQSTAISYQLPKDSWVSIKIYNTQGQEIKTLVDEFKTAGYYTVAWDGRDNGNNLVVSGIYLYRINMGNYVCTKKMSMVQ